MSEVLLKSDNWPKNVYIILLGGCWREKWQTNTPKIAVTSGKTCHNDKDKAAVAKSKLHPFHWQQSEELALRNVCLGNMDKLYKDIVYCKEFGVKLLYYENIDMLIVDVRLLSFSTLGTRMAVCLYELVLTLTCKHSRNVSPQCNHPHQCCLGTPPCHHLAPWKIKNQTQRHHPTPNTLRNTNTKALPNHPSIS